MKIDEMDEVDEMDPRLNEPAFPVITDNPPSLALYTGMTLRDWFAAAALSGLISLESDADINGLAHDAYSQADALLKYRNRNTPAVAIDQAGHVAVGQVEKSHERQIIDDLTEQLNSAIEAGRDMDEEMSELRRSNEILRKRESERLRDDFAAAAMTGILAGIYATPDSWKTDHAEVSDEAYKYADAMLRRREQP